MDISRRESASGFRRGRDKRHSCDFERSRQATAPRRHCLIERLNEVFCVVQNTKQVAVDGVVAGELVELAPDLALVE